MNNLEHQVVPKSSTINCRNGFAPLRPMDRGSDKIIGLSKKIYAKSYASYSGTIYGIAKRIVTEERLAEQILTQAFITLNAQGQLSVVQPISFRYLFAATTSAAKSLLSGRFTPDEINARIYRERERLLGYARKA